ncbi:hypothetical protein [Vreelandella rituensis]
MDIAGLWKRWCSHAGEIMHSNTMLTVNADESVELLQRYSAD